MARILIITKRQYTNKDLIDDRFGRLREIPFELSRRGHDVRGICLSYKNKPQRYFRDGRVLWQSRNLSLFKLPGILRFTYKADLLARESDVVLACSDSIYGILGYVIACRRNIPLIFDLYDNFEYFLLGRLPLIRQLYHWVLRRSDAVTCVSVPLAHLVATLRKRPGVFVVENAARTDIFKPLDKAACRRSLDLPEHGIFIGTTGAIHLNRGIDTLFDAFYKLKEEIPDLHLVLAGKWDAGVRYPSDDHIHYLGALPLRQVPLVINSLDVGIVFNLDDAFGRYCYPQKAHEIMACGVPLAAADVGSMARLFRHDPNRLFQPRDVASLIRSILFCLKNRDKKMPAPQTWRQVTDQMAGVIRQVTSGAK